MAHKVVYGICENKCRVPISMLGNGSGFSCFKSESLKKLYDKSLGIVFCNHRGVFIADTETTETNWATMWNPISKTLTLNPNYNTGEYAMRGYVVIPYLEFIDNVHSGALVGVPPYICSVGFDAFYVGTVSSNIIGYVPKNEDGDTKPCLKIWQPNSGVQWAYCFTKVDGSEALLPTNDDDARTIVLCLH